MDLFKIRFSALLLSLVLALANCGGVPLEISPGGIIIVPLGGTEQLSANKEVQWALEGGPDQGSISSDGFYLAPAQLPADPDVTVTATAGQESAETVIYVRPPEAIAFNPDLAEQISQTPIDIFTSLLSLVFSGIADRLAVAPLGEVADAIWVQNNRMNTDADPTDDIVEIFFNQSFNLAGFGNERSLTFGSPVSAFATSLELDSLGNPAFLQLNLNSATSGQLGFRYSSDGGGSFGPWTPVNPAGFLQLNGQVAFDQNDMAYVSYASFFVGTAQIMLAKSNDFGATWQNIEVTPLATLQVAPFMLVSPDGTQICMCFQDSEVPILQPPGLEGANIYFTQSSDGGQTFSTPQRLTQGLNAALCRLALGPSGEVYLSYQQAGNVFLTRSLDGGATFSQALMVNQGNTQLTLNVPLLAVNAAGEIDLVYMFDTTGDDSGDVLVHARSIDGGQSFFPETPIAKGTGEANLVYPSGLRHDGTNRAHLMYFLTTQIASPLQASFDVFYLRGD